MKILTTFLTLIVLFHKLIACVQQTIQQVKHYLHPYWVRFTNTTPGRWVCTVGSLLVRLKNFLKPELVQTNLGFCTIPYPANFKAGAKLVGFTFVVCPPICPVVAPAIASGVIGALLLITLPFKLLAAR